MSSWKGKSAVVTGGTGALGSAVVAGLVERGASVVVPVFADKELERFELKDHDQITLVRGVDLTDQAQADKLFDDQPGLWASFHIAGGFQMGPIADADISMFDAMIRMNARTCYLCCRAAVRNFRKAGAGGRIVNVSARPAAFPELGAGTVAYTASKAAVAGITQALGAEVADDDILVNAVLPSLIDTPANRSAMPDADHSRWPSPKEIAQTMLFLASPDNTTTRCALVPVYGKS